MAKVIGVSHRSVQRVWNGAGLKPHLVHTFKLSNDPNFAEKVVERCRPLREPAGACAGAVRR